MLSVALRICHVPCILYASYASNLHLTDPPRLSQFLVKVIPRLGVFQIVRLLLSSSGPQFATHRRSPPVYCILHLVALLPALRARIFTHTHSTDNFLQDCWNAHHLIPLGGGGRQRPSSKASSRCCIRCASHGFGTGPGPGPGPGTNLGPAGCPGLCPGLSQAHGGG